MADFIAEISMLRQHKGRSPFGLSRISKWEWHNDNIKGFINHRMLPHRTVSSIHLAWGQVHY